MANSQPQSDGLGLETRHVGDISEAERILVRRERGGSAAIRYCAAVVTRGGAIEGRAPALRAPALLPSFICSADPTLKRFANRQEIMPTRKID